MGPGLLLEWWDVEETVKPRCTSLKMTGRERTPHIYISHITFIAFSFCRHQGRIWCQQEEGAGRYGASDLLLFSKRALFTYVEVVCEDGGKPEKSEGRE